MNLPPSAAAPAPEPAAPVRRLSGRLAWFALAFVLIAYGPLFLCMPLNFDALHYDLCARTLLRGGVLYRDIFDNNLPGAIWMQTGFRALLGWRSEALRLADLTVLSAAVVMLLRWLPARGAGASARVWTAAALAAFYLSAPQLAHCQRDGWMLLPAVAALCLRRRRLTPAGAAAALPAAVLEGLCWGAAFWVKPFVAVPVLASWLAWALASRRSRAAVLCDAAAVLGGGLVAGGLGLAWLAASGSWRAFWDVLLVWNRDYAAYAHVHESRLTALALWALYGLPWSLVHLAAVPVALLAVARAVRDRGAHPGEAASRALLAAFYLGWLAQATLLQRITDYGMAAPAFPAIVLVADALRTGRRPALRLALLSPVALAALFLSPGLRPQRLALWPRCWLEGSTPELRDRLALPTWWGDPVDWRDLARVADFLRAQGVGDGEVTCMSGCTHELYLDLNVTPPMRFPQLHATTLYFPSHVGEILEGLKASRSRYVVNDLSVETSLTDEEVRAADPADPLALPTDFLDRCLGTYPWGSPVVFRSGRYVVHRVADPAPLFRRDDTWQETRGLFLNRYEREFVGRLSFRDEGAARESVAAIDGLYRQSEETGDKEDRHQALRAALTMYDEARWAGKPSEANLFRRWLEGRIGEEPADAGPKTAETGDAP